MAYIDKNKKKFFFRGRLEGSLIFPPKGKNGFGYDPIFKPLGYSKTLAEMTIKEKNKISHRKNALNYFIKEIRSNFS